MDEGTRDGAAVIVDSGEREIQRPALLDSAATRAHDKSTCAISVRLPQRDLDATKVHKLERRIFQSFLKVYASGVNCLAFRFTSPVALKTRLAASAEALLMSNLSPSPRIHTAKRRLSIAASHGRWPSIS